MGAISAGFLADVGLSLLFFTILVTIVGGGGASPDEVQRQMTGSLELALSGGLVGLAFTGVGGYIAALVARQKHVEHAVGVGLLSLGLGVTSLLFGGLPEQNAWVTLVGMALTVPFAAFGGWYRKQTEKPL